MLSHRSVNRLLVVNAASQGETIEDVLAAYRANTCRGVVLSKIDEAVKLAPALDALIRHKVKVLAVANGQRVPEDWHRLSAQALVQRALRSGGSRPGSSTTTTSAWSSAASRRWARPRWPPDRHLRPDARQRHAPRPFTASAPADQASGLRRLFAPVRRRLLPVAANPFVPSPARPCSKRCRRHWPRKGRQVLVVDAAGTAPAPHETALFDLAAGVEQLHEQVCYLAARGVPLAHVDTHGSAAAFVDAAVRRRAAVRRGAAACRPHRPGAHARPARRAPAAAGGRRAGLDQAGLCLLQAAGAALRADDLRPAAGGQRRAAAASAPSPSAWPAAPTPSSAPCCTTGPSSTRWPTRRPRTTPRWRGAGRPAGPRRPRPTAACAHGRPLRRRAARAPCPPRSRPDLREPHRPCTPPRDNSTTDRCSSSTARWCAAWRTR
jgi:hypothetical protein